MYICSSNMKPEKDHVDQHSSFIYWWWEEKRVKTKIFRHSSLPFLFYDLSNSPPFLVTVGLKADPPSSSWPTWMCTSWSSIYQKQVRKYSYDFITQAHLEDTASWAPDHCNKAHITIKHIHISDFPVHIKIMFTLYYIVCKWVIALCLKKCTYYNLKIFYW